MFLLEKNYENEYFVCGVILIANGEFKIILILIDSYNHNGEFKCNWMILQQKLWKYIIYFINF